MAVFCQTTVISRFYSCLAEQINLKTMGEYRFSVYAKWQLGLSISFDGQIVLGLPFIDVRFAISKHAKGVEIFGWYSS